jgi:hypothetical protein
MMAFHFECFVLTPIPCSEWYSLSPGGLLLPQGSGEISPLHSFLVPVEMTGLNPLT